jgi:hypothetical protein
MVVLVVVVVGVDVVAYVFVVVVAPMLVDIFLDSILSFGIGVGVAADSSDECRRGISTLDGDASI